MKDTNFTEIPVQFTQSHYDFSIIVYFTEKTGFVLLVQTVTGCFI